jgi:hypothetical protein
MKIRQLLFTAELVNRFLIIISCKKKGLEKLLLDLPAAIIQILLGLILLSSIILFL